MFPITKNIQWFPGHMAKAKRKIAEDLALVDVAIIVLDARVPYASYNPDFEPILRDKPRIVVLNKEDLADPNATKIWLNYYRSLGFAAVSLCAARKQGMDKLLKEAIRIADPVMVALQAKGRLPRAVRALVVGAPNTGKSTLINALMPKAVVRTANKPGVTRGRQWIRINDKIELVDTPGILVPKFDSKTVAMYLSFCGSIPQDIYDEEEVGYALLTWLCKHKPEALMSRYKLSTCDKEMHELMYDIGKSRGLLRSGGEVRESEVSILLISEFRNGLLGRVTLDDPALARRLEGVTEALDEN